MGFLMKWNVSLMEFSLEFRKEVMRGYHKDSRWSLVIVTLKKEERSKDRTFYAKNYCTECTRKTAAEKRSCVSLAAYNKLIKEKFDEALAADRMIRCER